MKIERDFIEDPHVYEIMYFSPIEVGDERYTNQLYFQTDVYTRQMPTSMIERMNAQVDQLRHVELGITPFDLPFKQRHREAVLFHCKMALAYLDAREARISMKLCTLCEPATKSTESRILQDQQADFDFLRITTLSVMACASRRVKFYDKAVSALEQAKDLCMQEGENNRVHPLLTALTLLNLSAVLGDIDHDKHGLRWGLEALSMMYGLFSQGVLPEVVQAYYLVLACHNAALLNAKLGRWAEAVELVGEGIEFTKILPDNEDRLRDKLIAIGAQAKHVPENFLAEAVNALNGWGEERGVWNLSFWDFSVNEIKEEIHVLKYTTTLKHLIIEHYEEEDRCANVSVEDTDLARFILAVVSCQPLEQFSISGIDFDPRKVWRRIKKRSFLETSWYASTLNFASILESAQKPEVANYKKLMKNLNSFSKKLIIFLVTLGNECEGIDLSENAIDKLSISALVCALRWSARPPFTREVSKVILRENAIDAATAGLIAKIWNPKEEVEEKAPPEQEVVFTPEPPGSPAGAVAEEKGVTSLDVSWNANIGDRGFDLLTSGIMQSPNFRVLKADTIGLQTPGARAVAKLETTRLELLCLSNNQILSEGARLVVEAARRFRSLHTLQLDNCGIDHAVAADLGRLTKEHATLRDISLNNNSLGSSGVVEFCAGAAESSCLKSVHLAYNGINTEEAAEAIGDMMRRCQTLLEMNLSGNAIEPKGAPHIGSAIEHSKVLTMHLVDMGFTGGTIDDFLDHGAAETQDLQVMILNDNPVGDEGLSIIAECLSIGLTDLSLSNCELTAASQATLLNLVSLSPNLRSLDLSNNDLGPNGCTDMVTWMKHNEKDNFCLRSLELANCGLGDEGLLHLVPILGSLTYLGLRKNGITSDGLAAVMNSSQMIQLRCLDLADNLIGEQGVHALTERFQQEHKRSLWNPKQLTSTIDRVILKNNPDISRGLAKSTEAFLKINNPLLTVVWFDE